MPRHEGPIAAEHYAVGPHLIQQEAERLLAADHRVVVETALVLTRRPRDAPRLRASLPAAIEPTHGVAGGAAPVANTGGECGQASQHAAGVQKANTNPSAKNAPRLLKSPSRGVRCM